MSDGPGLRLVALPADGPGAVTLDGEARPTVTAALADARPGSVVAVGRGRYGADTETFPLRVPAGVTVRGPEPPEVPREARKHLPTPRPAAFVAPGPVLEVVGDDATVAHLTLTTTTPGAAPALRLGAVAGVTVDTCACSGSVHVEGATDLDVRWTTVTHGTVVTSGVTDLRVTGGGITGTHGRDALVTVTDGRDVRIEAAALTDGTVGVALVDCVGVLVGGCAVLADVTAVEATGSRGVHVAGNRLRGDRAVHLVDCVEVEVTANGVERATVAFTLDRCRDVQRSANHLGEVTTALEVDGAVGDDEPH